MDSNKIKKGLGRGLSSLIGETKIETQKNRLSEAPSHGMPVLLYDKTCPGSKAYFSLTDEFLNQETTMGSAA